MEHLLVGHYRAAWGFILRQKGGWWWAVWGQVGKPSNQISKTSPYNTASKTRLLLTFWHDWPGIQHYIVTCCFILVKTTHNTTDTQSYIQYDFSPWVQTLRKEKKSAVTVTSILEYGRAGLFLVAFFPKHLAKDIVSRICCPWTFWKKREICATRVHVMVPVGPAEIQNIHGL